MLSKLKFEISGDDFREGLTAVVSVKVRNLSSKVRPKPNWVTLKSVCRDQAVSEMLTNYLEEHPK